ncbi:hypothetical protein AH156_13790 [Salmonella enterica subsp. enterica serovar Enteritidis]|nr:hypothetical protein [Salmonella enterica subsp. enterica serovar Enteritidis]EEI9691666.1 hypothetical protein [Salmonella enterica subsp. enterica serovar Hillingdon]
MTTRPLSQLKKAARIWDKAHRGIAAFWLRQHATSKQGEYHPKESKLQILKKLREQQKAQSTSVNAGDFQSDKTQQSAEYSEPTHEYLSIVLPMSASHPVEILGYPNNVDLKFVRRAEHVLTILRVVSSYVDNSTQFSDLAYADQLLKEVAGLLCGIESQKEKHRKCPACRMRK